MLEQESELRRAIEAVAAVRRELPPGGAVADDYVFQEAFWGSELVYQAPDPGQDPRLAETIDPLWSLSTAPRGAAGPTGTRR